jgi:hypothetical protein
VRWRKSDWKTRWEAEGDPQKVPDTFFSPFFSRIWGFPKQRRRGVGFRAEDLLPAAQISDSVNLGKYRYTLA